MVQIAQILVKIVREILANLMMEHALIQEIVKIINFMKINAKNLVQILVLLVILVIGLEYVKIAQMNYIMEMIAQIHVINVLHLHVIWKEFVEILLLIGLMRRLMDQNLKMIAQKLV
jgi:hypothetical protein